MSSQSKSIISKPRFQWINQHWINVEEEKAKHPVGSLGYQFPELLVSSSPYSSPVVMYDTQSNPWRPIELS